MPFVEAVSPGEWIRVEVPGDPWPVTMSIGDAAPEPAFIDHERAAGGVRTLAQRRCPPLRPGSHAVVVRTPTETIRGSIEVSGELEPDAPPRAVRRAVWRP